MSDSQTTDSGMDQRMVNLPIYYTNPESVDSRQLEYENWLDMHQPGNAQWAAIQDAHWAALQEAEDSPNVSLVDSEEFELGWINQDNFDFPLDPAQSEHSENTEPEQSNESPSEVSPVHIHLQGCECNGCNRLSPSTDGDSLSLSFPADMNAVAARLRALKELWLLEINVDMIHKTAEIEEREMIREFQVMDTLKRRHDFNQKHTPSGVHYMNTATGYYKDQDMNNGTTGSDVISIPQGSEHTSDINVGLVHANAEANEEKSKKIFRDFSLRSATFAMVNRCRLDKGLDELEAIADEIHNQDETAQGDLGDVKGGRVYAPFQPP